MPAEPKGEVPLSQVRQQAGAKAVPQFSAKLLGLAHSAQTSPTAMPAKATALCVAEGLTAGVMRRA